QSRRKRHTPRRPGRMEPNLGPPVSGDPLMTLPRCWLFALFLLGATLPLGAADTKADDVKLSKEEQEILDQTNEARAKEKLPPLKVNGTLLKVARAHAANMAKQKKMEHTLDGKDPAQRVEKAGYDYRKVGENIAWGEKGAKIATVFKGWM